MEYCGAAKAMQRCMTIDLFNHTFELLPERALYWENRQTLILSDLHVGKGMHFRKAGVPVPQEVFRQDLERLTRLIYDYNPQQLLIVGDMFHSDRNNEVNLFDVWRAGFNLDVVLVKGNHDIMPRHTYTDAGIAVYDDLAIDNFLFTHEPPQAKNIAQFNYCFSGHLHPGVRLEGFAKQSLKFPCFYFGNQYAILPAFGGFTGLALINPQPGDEVFAIVENEVVPLQ